MTILDSSKLKEFADDNLKVDENDRQFAKWIETIVEKREITCVKRLVLQTPRNQGLFWKGLSCALLSGALRLIESSWSAECNTILSAYTFYRHLE